VQRSPVAGCTVARIGVHRYRGVTTFAILPR
jgi:hypothetical protein